MIPSGCVQRCPGCKYRELSLEESNQKKMDWVRWNLPTATIEPIISPNERWFYRNKALLHAKFSDGWQFGFLRKKRNEEEFIAIPECPIHEPYIKKILLSLSNLPKEIPLVFVYIQGKALSFILKTKEEKFRALLPTQIPGIESVWMNLSPSAGRRVFNSKGWVHLSGKTWLGEEIQYGPSAFQQVSPLTEHALDLAEDFLQEAQCNRILDLYSGIGLSALRWKKRNWNVLGVELNKEACMVATRNSGVEILVGRVEERIPQLDGDDFIVYTNPPRTGHDPKILNFFQRKQPKRIAYLSCNVKTLAKDIQLLGYKIEKVQPYDFYPQTDHVEVLALLTSKTF